MENPEKDEPEVDLPARLAQPALRALSAAGIAAWNSSPPSRKPTC